MIRKLNGPMLGSYQERKLDMHLIRETNQQPTRGFALHAQQTKFLINMHNKPRCHFKCRVSNLQNIQVKKPRCMQLVFSFFFFFCKSFETS